MTIQNLKPSHIGVVVRRCRNFAFCILHFAFRNFPQKNSGFTLIETVVALSVLLAALTGPVALITRGVLSFSFSKNKLVAVNLAQEGIELMRLVREDNIICDILNGPAAWNWNRDPEGGNLTRTAREADALSSVTLTCGSSSISVPRLPVFTNQPLRLNAATGIYSYGAGDETIFRRKIEINVPPDEPDGDIPSSDQMDLIVTVEWNERGISRNVTLRERLYNWR